MVIVHSQFVFGLPANAILSTVLSVYAVNRTLSQHSTLCIHLRVSLRGPMLANLSMADPGSWNIAPLSSLSTVIKVRSLVREADIDARRWLLTRLIAEKLRSADADATGIVSITLSSASRSGNARCILDSSANSCIEVVGRSPVRNVFFATSAWDWRRSRSKLSVDEC